MWNALKRYFTLPGDTPTHVLHKVVASVFLGGVSAGWVILIFRLITGIELETTTDILGMVAVSVCLPLFLWVVATRKLPCTSMMGMVMVLYSAIVLYSDLATIYRGTFRTWPFIMVLVDLCLLLGIPDGFTKVLAGMLLFWIPLVNIDAEYDIGMRLLVMESNNYCTCDNPPCPQGPTYLMRTTFMSLLVFFLDMIMTRRFAHGLRLQQTKVEASVKLAGKIASALTKFNLEQATMYIAQSDDTMPRELVEAFTVLIQNLSSYRPYLPDSCFAGDAGDDEEDEVHGPMTIHSTESASTASISQSHFAESKQSEQHAYAGHYVTTKAVSIMVVTVKDYLTKVNETTLAHYQHDWVTTTLVKVRACRGVLDEFNGDRLVVVFNGSRACGSHVAAALRCAVLMRENGYEGQAVGTASGRAMCGDLGNDEMRRYSVVGSVMDQAHLLSRVAGVWELVAVAHGCMIREAGGVVVVGRLLVEQFQFTDSEMPVSVYEVVYEATCSEEEWMYQLDAMQEQNPYSKMNAALQTAHCGNIEEALCMLKETDRVEELLDVVSRYRDAGQGLPVVKVSAFHVDSPPLPLSFQRNA